MKKWIYASLLMAFLLFMVLMFLLTTGDIADVWLNNTGAYLPVK